MLLPPEVRQPVPLYHQKWKGGTPPSSVQDYGFVAVTSTVDVMTDPPALFRAST